MTHVVFVYRGGKSLGWKAPKSAAFRATATFSFVWWVQLKWSTPMVALSKDHTQTGGNEKDLKPTNTFMHFES